MIKIRPQVAIVLLALIMMVWVGYLTYQVYTFPTIASMMGDKDLAVIENDGKFYYIFSEMALEKPITITDSKGTIHYLLSREKLIALVHATIDRVIDRVIEKIDRVIERIQKDPLTFRRGLLHSR